MLQIRVMRLSRVFFLRLRRAVIGFLSVIDGFLNTFLPGLVSIKPSLRYFLKYLFPPFLSFFLTLFFVDRLNFRNSQYERRVNIASEAQKMMDSRIWLYARFQTYLEQGVLSKDSYGKLYEDISESTNDWIKNKEYTKDQLKRYFSAQLSDVFLDIDARVKVLHRYNYTSLNRICRDFTEKISDQDQFPDCMKLTKSCKDVKKIPALKTMNCAEASKYCPVLEAFVPKKSDLDLDKLINYCHFRGRLDDLQKVKSDLLGALETESSRLSVANYLFNF
jgi:hypothetical protein